MKITVYFLFTGGLALFTFLIGYYGFTDVSAALAFSGLGLIWVAMFHLIPLIVNTIAWQCLLPYRNRPSFHVIVWVRWIGESINSLLPAAQVGGHLAKARLLIHHGVQGPIAGSSVVVELTISVVTQIIFTLMGVVLLLRINVPEIVNSILIGLGIMALLVTGFCFAQRFGMFGRLIRVLTRFGGDRDWEYLVGGAAAIDKAILQIYSNSRSLLAAGFWRICGWIVGTGEVWIALYFLGSPVSFTHALLLESLGQAVRAAAFLIPGGLGVQEGGYLAFGSLLGLSPDISLALSLTKRVRELLLGLPGLIAWQVVEMHGFLHRCSKLLRKFISKPVE